jgi:hypothetical protein
MAKICSTCEAENRDDAPFCKACGTSFENSRPGMQGVASDRVPAPASDRAPAADDHNSAARHGSGAEAFTASGAGGSGAGAPAMASADAMARDTARFEARRPPHPAEDYPPSLNEGRDPGPARSQHGDRLEQTVAPDPVDARTAWAGAAAPAPRPAANRTMLWVGVGAAALAVVAAAAWFTQTAPGAPPEPGSGQARCRR